MPRSLRIASANVLAALVIVFVGGPYPVSIGAAGSILPLLLLITLAEATRELGEAQPYTREAALPIAAMCVSAIPFVVLLGMFAALGGDVSWLPGDPL
jgi:hypothetical protein